MRNFTRNVMSRVKYKVLISTVVIITAFFAFTNIFGSYAYITNNQAINLGQGNPTLTRWDAASNNHGYVNFGMFAKTEIHETVLSYDVGFTAGGSSSPANITNPLYEALENATPLDHYLFKMGSLYSDAPLTNSPVVYYNGSYYVKDKAGADTDKWFKLEPITWRILNVDETNNKVLLFANEVIEARRWNDSVSTYKKWSDMPDIVSDLNNDIIGLTYYDTSFYNKAFSPKEKEYIKCEANDYQYADRDGSATSLYVRLLSAYEMFDLKNSDNNKTLFAGGANYGFASANNTTGITSKRLGYPTDYSMAGASSSDWSMIESIGEITMKYWTRSALHTTSGENHGLYIAPNGISANHDLYNIKLGVRPVITLDLDFFKDETILGSGTESDPYYAKMTYNVNYNLGDADSGSVPSMTEVNAGDTYTLSDVTLTKDNVNIGCAHINIGDGSPVVDRYVVNSFIQDGWTTSLGGAKVYSLGETITPNGDLDLYPSWSVTTIPITFPSVPLREGYVWDGWEDRPDGTGNPITSYSGTNPHYQIYGTWHPLSFKNSVTFVGNGGTGVPSELFHIMDYPNTQYTFTIPDGEPTRSGYNFDGWYDSPSGGNKYTTNIVSGENNHVGDQVTYVYAHWTRTTAPTTEVELIIDPNGGLYEGQASKTYNVHKHDGSLTEDGECYDVVYHVHNSTCEYTYTTQEYVYCEGELTWNNYDEGRVYCYSCGSVFKAPPYPGSKHNTSVLRTVYKTGYNCAYKDYTSGEQVPGNIESATMTCTEDDFQAISNPVKSGYTFTGWSSSTEFNTYSEDSETRWKGNSDTVLTANYSANTYTVSFNADNGGSNPSSQSVTFGSSYGTLPSPTKTGYDFDGWYTSASGGSKVTSTTIVSIASNHTLYARYTPKDITVSFSTYISGDNPANITVTFNSAYGSDLPSKPLNDRTGYTFDGWFTSASGGTKVTSATIVTNSSNHTLYAHYTPLSFDIIYNRGDATSTNVPENQIATYNSNLTLAVNNMTKHDSANGYVITYNMGVATGGDLPSASIQTTSYTADGWSLVINGSKKYDSGYVFSPYKYINGFTFYPHWIETKNKVTLESNTLSKDPTAKCTVTYKFQDGVTSDVNRNVMSLYTPNGWSTTNGGAKVYDNADEIEPSSNMDLYPYFDSTNEPAINPEIPQRIGYTFKEWNTSADGTGTTYTSYNGNSDITLYAIWEGIEYTNEIIFVGNGATGVPSNHSETVTYPNTQVTISMPTDPQKDGYTFDGWYDCAVGGNKFTTSIIGGANNVSDNQTTYVYARFTRLPSSTSVDLTIDPNGGLYEGLTTKSYLVHKHDGSMTEDGECYDVVYHVHDGNTTSGGACYTYVTSPTPQPGLTADICGGAFKVINPEYQSWAGGWFYRIECASCGWPEPNQQFSVDNMGSMAYLPSQFYCTQPRGLYKGYLLTCDYKDYASGEQVIGNIESAIPTCTLDDYQVISVPVKTGYTFTGWTSDTEFNTYTESSETRWKGNSDTVLTANYSVNTYTVSFDADNGGNNPANQTVTYDSAYGSLPSVSKTGYTFLGWYSQASGGNLVTSTTTVTTASNHTLYAHYSVKKPTLYFNANYPSGVNPGSKEITYGEMYGILPTMSRDGYTFLGWFTDATSGSEITSTSIVNVENDQTLYAHYSANNYTITYYQGDATSTNVPSSQTATFDSNITLATNSMTKSDTLSGYTITYNMGRANSGTLPASVTQSYSYSADGWSTLSGSTKVYASGHIFSPYNLTNNLNLYPAWIVTKNNVTLATNNLVRDDKAVSTVTFKYQDGTTSDAVRDVIRSYTNDGWGTTIDGNKVYDDGEVITPSSNIILYPSYTYVDTPITFPASPSRTGYTFREWNTSLDGTGTAYTSYDGTSNLTLYAIWDGISYTNTLKYDVTTNGGSAVIADDTKTVTYPNTISNHTLTSIVPTKTGYDFIGWYDMPTGGNFVSSPVSVGNNNYVGNQDRTIYAQFDKNKYTVSFKNKDKTQDLFTPLHIEYNDQIGDIYDASHIPTLDGYLFGGWYLDTDSTYQNKITSSYNVTSNITLVPRWYEVSFDALIKEYTGSNVEPVITVSDDSTSPVVLTKDTDYTVSDTGDKVNYGSRTITVSGDNSKGIYGSVSKTFKIERKGISYQDVIITNYNDSDNTINKEFDLSDKTNVKIKVSNIDLAWNADTDIKFNFNLDNSFYSSASPSNTVHKDITLANISIDTTSASNRANNYYYSGPSSLTFTDYGMILDTMRPVITNVEIISSQTIYGLGQDIVFKVTTNEDLVNTSGTPVMKLKINSPSDNDMGYADYDSTNSLNDSHTFIFKHKVVTSDNGVCGKLKVALEVTGGTCSDSCGNELDRTLDDSNQTIKDIEINTDGFVIPSSMIPNILASETTSDNEVIVTYDLSDISLFTTYSLDTLIANLTVSCDIDNVITNITSDNNIVTITKDDSGANKKVTVKVDTTKILNETTNYRNGIKLTFDIPKEVLVNDINNKNIASHNEIKVLRTLNDSDIIVKHNGNILDHLGTIYKAYENDVIEVLLKDGALGTLSYDQSPNTIISNTLYKFTNFILTKVNYVSSLPFDIEFKVRTKQDVLDDINAIITDPNKDDDQKSNDLKDILDNKKDLDFFNPPLTDDDIDYIINNPGDIAKIFVDDNKDIIPDDSTLVDKLKDAIEKDKANKTYKPKKKKKKLNVKEEETVIDDKGEEKVITHVPYLVGYKDKTIRPDGNITRGEISSLISHISSDYDSNFDYTPNITKFKDSNKKAWHSNYLGFLAKENIFEGYSDKTIKSERYITRGEFAKTICVLFELDTKETNKNKKHVFKDSKNKWYEEYANTLWEYGYIDGYNDNTFRGNKTITRAEAVKIINKALDRKLKDDTTLTEEERLEFENKFIDVLHKWYYYDLFEATMSY